jgi:hypothetical protein
MNAGHGNRLVVDFESGDRDAFGRDADGMTSLVPRGGWWANYKRTIAVLTPDNSNFSIEALRQDDGVEHALAVYKRLSFT